MIENGWMKSYNMCKVQCSVLVTVQQCVYTVFCLVSSFLISQHVETKMLPRARFKTLGNITNLDHFLTSVQSVQSAKVDATCTG